MKIALLTDGIHPYVVGGIQKHSYYFCKHLIEAGHTIVLVHTAAPAERQQAEGLEIFTEAERSRIQAVFIPFPGPWRFPLHYLAESFAYSPRHRPELPFPDPGMRLCLCTGAYGLVFDAATILRKTSCGGQPAGVEYVSANFPLERADPIRHLTPGLWWVARNADASQSVGGKLTPLLRKIGVKQEAIFVAGMGIDRSWINYGAAENLNPVRKMVFIGRYEQLKGIDELSVALKHLADQSVPFEMHFVGPIPEEHQLTGSSFIYHGLVRDAGLIRNLLCGADILLCPSYSEGMPSVILEAMASGCAVVATDVGAVAELTDPSTGWLIPAGDIPALEEAIRAALEFPEDQLQRMKKTAVRKVEAEYCWDHVIAVTYTRIVEILRRRQLLPEPVHA